METVQGTSTKGFLWGWWFANLFGWMIGIYSAALRMRSILELIGYADRPPDTIAILFTQIGLPLGLGIGLLQCWPLARWKVRFFPWLLATVTGFGLPALAFTFLRQRLLFSTSGINFMTYLQHPFIFYTLGLLVVGVLVGFLQSLALGNRLPHPEYWIGAVVAGILVFGWVVLWLFGIPGFIDAAYVAAGRFNQYTLPFATTWLVIGAALPVLAALITALPTGWVLQRFAAPHD